MNEVGRGSKRASRVSRIWMTACLLTAAFLAGGVDGLVAQRRGDPSGGRRAEMERRIQARFDNLVREELGLDDEQVQRLQDVVEDFRQRRVEFAQRERDARRRVAGLGTDGGAQDVTEEEASAILAEMLALSDEEAMLFREEQEAFRQILTPPQLVRFIVMRQQLGDRIRNLRGRGGRR